MFFLRFSVHQKWKFDVSTLSYFQPHWKFVIFRVFLIFSKSDRDLGSEKWDPHSCVSISFDSFAVYNSSKAPTFVKIAFNYLAALCYTAKKTCWDTKMIQHFSSTFSVLHPTHLYGYAKRKFFLLSLKHDASSLVFHWRKISAQKSKNKNIEERKKLKITFN